jgi:hypothetical protein
MSTGYVDLPVTGGGGGTWGSITGDIADQTDLQDALDAKEAIYDWDINPDRQFVFFTDFIENDRAGLTVAANVGGGTGQAVNNDTTTLLNTTENCIGNVNFALGTGTTARLSIFSSGLLVFGTAALEYGVRHAIDVVSDATNAYTSYLGFFDAPGAGDATDGAYFRYTHSVNSGRWEAVVADGGVRTPLDTGVSPTGNIMQVFRIVVNSAGTQALFYIDGSLVATHNSGLPGAGDFTLWCNKIEKSAGTTSRAMILDWAYLKATRTTAR